MVFMFFEEQEMEAEKEGPGAGRAAAATAADASPGTFTINAAPLMQQWSYNSTMHFNRAGMCFM